MCDCLLDGGYRRTIKIIYYKTKKKDGSISKNTDTTPYIRQLTHAQSDWSNMSAGGSIKLTVQGDRTKCERALNDFSNSH